MAIIEEPGRSRAGDGGSPIRRPILTLVVTHPMGCSRRLADRVVFGEASKILEVQPPDHFFDNPQRERCRAFLCKILKH